MQFNKIRLVLAVAVFLLVFGILALVFWDFVRESIVIPLYYFLWVAGLIINSIPQEIYLVVLCIISLFIAVNAVGKIQVSESGTRTQAKVNEEISRYRFWRNLCQRSFSDAFSRQNFATEARKLILAILQYQEGYSAREIEQRLANDQIIAPAIVKKLILDRTLEDYHEPRKSWLAGRKWWNQLFRKARTSEEGRVLEEAMEEIARFIETRLEINRGDLQ